MRIAVAGGTGLAGTFVVAAAREAGHEVRVIARSRGTDLITGTGLDDALSGVSAVIDVSNITTTRQGPAQAFFETGTRNLMAAGLRAGARHHVLLSIAGVDRAPLGYYQGKRHQEELVLAGAVPATVLRATQFFEFPEQLMSRMPGPVALVPAMNCQPVAVQEVARALVALAVAAPAGIVAEMAGPQVFSLPGMARQVLRARGRRRIVVPVRMPGAAGRAIRAGALLPAGEGPRGQLTLAQWLAQGPAAEQPDRPGISGTMA